MPTSAKGLSDSLNKEVFRIFTVRHLRNPQLIYDVKLRAVCRFKTQKNMFMSKMHPETVKKVLREKNGGLFVSRHGYQGGFAAVALSFHCTVKGEEK